MEDLSNIPYGKSIDYLVEKNPTFFDELHEELFEDFKRQWIELFPLYVPAAWDKVLKRQKEILADPKCKRFHPWSEWLIAEITKQGEDQ